MSTGWQMYDPETGQNRDLNPDELFVLRHWIERDAAQVALTLAGYTTDTFNPIQVQAPAEESQT